MRKVTSALAVASAFGVLALATPASAHVTVATVYDNRNIKAGSASVNSTHTTFYACDMLADNVGVYGRMKLSNGQIRDVADSNGSADGCGVGTAPAGTTIIQIEAVWRGGKTSGWKTT
ncbi:hypothetical protein FDA94_29965 [Herbidospora galbida]|uniref:Uncharacterized protein n=1 Tax=Herbidospora galbida TaxID=2575442 RepID=A0A4U3MA06_9ACTN|nr:hypothetical protein [Herbidospora galbida]TKK84366.1 hypothetical protein FDA94_29965 [Herbidospora galbida]